MATSKVTPLPVDKDSLDRILQRAVEVIGDREQALRWFGTPVRALNFQTPVSQLGTRQGKEAVESVLSRLENGVF